MPIQIFEAADSMLGSYTDGVPDDIRDEILRTIDAVDSVVPGIRKVMEVSNLTILYDEKNRHGVFTEEYRGHRGAYFWPLHMMYLANSGIKKSIAHEAAHMIDILAGPMKSETDEKYGRRIVAPISFYSFFPFGGRVIAENMHSHFDPTTNFIASFLMKAMIECKWLRSDEKVKDNILYKLGNATMDDAQVVNLITERVAQLMEEYVFVVQTERNVSKPLGVSSAHYFSKEKIKSVWWGSEWILENQSDIHRFYQMMIETIIDRQRNGYLKKRLKEQFDEFGTQLR